MRSNFDPNDKKENQLEKKQASPAVKDWDLSEEARDTFVKDLKRICRTAVDNNIPLTVLAQISQEDNGKKGGFVSAGGYADKGEHPAHPAFRAINEIVKLAMGNGTSEDQGLWLEDICDILELAKDLHDKRNGGKK